MNNKLLISELKKRTMSNKAQIKNLKYKLKILRCDIEPYDYYGCKYLAYLNTLSGFDRKYSENIRILIDMSDTKKRVELIGKTILLIRGDKWRI